MIKIFAGLALLLGFGLHAQDQDVSIYLIGDVGNPRLPNDPNLEYLRETTAGASESDVLIFLGDNIYPRGLPGKEDPQREVMEAKLNASLDVMKDFPGKVFMIPGNHDWADAESRGWSQVLNMARYVDNYLDSEEVFLPKGGCPGPIEIPVSPEILLVIMDTQYLLHRWDKPDQDNGCDAKSSADALLLLDDILSRNRDKHVIVAGHHPMYSFGPHGSKYTFKQHLFPLTDLNKKLWIPLPVIGSIYPIFRSFFGTRQDLPNPRYKMIRNSMVEIFSQVGDLVYVSGHEHSLQYIQRDSAHYVVSGSGSKSSNSAAGLGTKFHDQTHGFARLKYADDGAVTLTFYDGDAKETLYEEELNKKIIIKPSPADFETDYTDSTVVKPISLQYQDANTFWFGENYRDIWATPVEMRVFNIGKEKGGLEIVKLGGGNQTKSLRLKDETGKEYSLRSLDKYPQRLLPAELYKTLAADLLQDRVSGANPYGAFAVPPMAKALGLYHFNPELVYIPDDPRFGHYRSIFADMPAMFVEHANDEAAHQPFFGSGVDIENTAELIEELHDDNDEEVDQPFALKARLFDMVIGDWDRHEDQWEWVAREKEKGHIWRPIGKDRDQVFFVSEGVFGWASSRKFAVPNTEGFTERMDFPPGYNTSARFFDRTFLTSLDWSDWVQKIEEIQTELTNEVIENALKTWPDTIYQQIGEETAKILQARRADMPRFARDYYLFLAEEVEVVGSDKHEYFLVERLNDRETRVTVRKRGKDGDLEQVIYKRTFLEEETDEIRLFGLGGQDIFEVEGAVNEGIKVRIIGGEDADKITDRSNVRGWGKKTVVYDLEYNTELYKSNETRSKLKDDIRVNFYNRAYFEYDKLFPILNAQYNPDDGVFLGAGILYTREGWRKEPFASRHKITGNIALATGAPNFFYDGTFADVIGRWDLNLDLSFQRPYGVSNFFGFGNESTFDYKGENLASGYEDPINFYRVRYERSQNYLNLAYNLGQKGTFRIGVEHLSFAVQDDLNDTDEKFITSEGSGVDPAALNNRFQYVGVRSEVKTDTRNEGVPKRGVFAKFGYTKYYGLTAPTQNFTKIDGEFRFLISTKSPSKFTVANRIGAEYNFGNIEFFNGAFLGRETVRGYRRTRFVGNSSFYHNIDLRFQLVTFRTYLLPAAFGLVAFHDVGRVWYDGEKSDEWHTGKGLGIWLAPLNRFALTFNVAFSEEETLPFVSFGYQF